MVKSILKTTENVKAGMRKKIDKDRGQSYNISIVKKMPRQCIKVRKPVKSCIYMQNCGSQSGYFTQRSCDMIEKIKREAV